MTITGAALTLRAVSLSGPGQPRLKDLSVTLPRGQRLLLAGPNGAGKSSLLDVLSGDVVLSAGTLHWGPGAPPRWADRRAYLPQRNALAHPFSAAQVVALAGVGTSDALDHLEELGIKDWAEQPYPTLSGGLRRLVHMARVLAQLDRLVPEYGWGFFDEPLANLDWRYAGRVLNALERRAAAGYGILLAAHELNLALPWAEQVLLLAGGQGEAFGAPAAVFTPERLAAHWGVRGHFEAREGGGRLLLDSLEP
ncbi:MAG: ATP-binding cassette domain-containing protein [Pseudomonadales bacterium]|nr:ATP-binding cassette domain-containing protein [Pseudomonadales bacterium]